MKLKECMDIELIVLVHSRLGLRLTNFLNPSTIGTYTAGVRDVFRREHKDLDFFSDEG